MDQRNHILGTDGQQRKNHKSTSRLGKAGKMERQNHQKAWKRLAPRSDGPREIPSIMRRYLRAETTRLITKEQVTSNKPVDQ
ncbi:hypothetical protein DdX_22438 [Ditylenchus destructor]|uniref:Uncharacterized protein n=1 Tax=Ditylenchus destructor TaxID=166010 RepID=A0AAD4MDK9_9BILA|nr:hypothetical protein DdX_22438 [Ditylenchus destructor]